MKMQISCRNITSDTLTSSLRRCCTWTNTKFQIPAPAVSLKMLISIPLLLFSHLFVLGVCFLLPATHASSYSIQCEAWEPAQLQSSHGHSNEAVRESVPCSRAFWHYLSRSGLPSVVRIPWTLTYCHTIYKPPSVNIFCITSADNSFVSVQFGRISKFEHKSPEPVKQQVTRQLL